MLNQEEFSWFEVFWFRNSCVQEKKKELMETSQLRPGGGFDWWVI